MLERGGPSSGASIAGKYVLVQRLGEGGLGVVWRARRVSDDLPVAIKLLKAEHLAPRTLRRFAREAGALSAVRHPHVVLVHEVVDDGDRPALVLELLDGESLAQRLARERRLSPDLVAEILMCIAAAVGAAHALGIVHRDLKPANVLLAGSKESNAVKVVDFGIAKWIRPASGSATTLATATHGLIGTPCYMSPEQAFGDAVDHRSDLWSQQMLVAQVNALAPDPGLAIPARRSRPGDPGLAIAPRLRLVPELVRAGERVDGQRNHTHAEQHQEYGLQGDEAPAALLEVAPKRPAHSGANLRQGTLRGSPAGLACSR